jgi:hypothetical protein
MSDTEKKPTSDYEPPAGAVAEFMADAVAG